MIGKGDGMGGMAHIGSREDIAPLLRDLHAKSGKRLLHVGVRLGLDHKNMKLWHDGTHVPHIVNLIKLLRFYKATVTIGFEFEGEEQL